MKKRPAERYKCWICDKPAVRMLRGRWVCRRDNVVLAPPPASCGLDER